MSVRHDAHVKQQMEDRLRRQHELHQMEAAHATSRETFEKTSAYWNQMNRQAPNPGPYYTETVYNNPFPTAPTAAAAHISSKWHHRQMKPNGRF